MARPLMIGTALLLAALAGAVVHRLLQESRPPVDVASSVRAGSLRAVQVGYQATPGAAVPLEVFPNVVVSRGTASVRATLDPEISVGFLEPYSSAGFTVLTGPSDSNASLYDRVARTVGAQQYSLLGQLPSAGGAGGTTFVLVTSEFLVRTQPGVERARLDALAAAANSDVIEELSSVSERTFLLRVRTGGPLAGIEASRRMSSAPEVDGWSHPVLLVPGTARATSGPDPLASDQWHLSRIRAQDAWALGQLARGVTIAVIDDAIRVDHEDLADRLFKNPREIPGNGRDDDENGLVDDVSGWNFQKTEGASRKGSPAPYDRNTPSLTHGTQVAGLALATCNNNLGGCGVAPEASLLPLAIGDTRVLDPRELSAAIRYATAQGASVINNSWGLATNVAYFPELADALRRAMTEGRGGLGAVVVFARSNERFDNSAAPADISSTPGVIAVGRSTDRDEWGQSGFGEGAALLAPSGAASSSDRSNCLKPYLGKREILTTFVPQFAGEGAGRSCGCNVDEVEGVALGYTRCFSGTSAAAPLVSGAAALVLSTNPKLTAPQAIRILRQSSDPVDGANAHYGQGSDGTRTSLTHGSGRLNVLQAVVMASAKLVDGKGSSRAPETARRETRAVTVPRRGPSAASRPGAGARSSSRPTLVAGKPSVRLRVPGAGDASEFWVWRDVRVILLSEGASDAPSRFTSLGLSLIPDFNWPREMLNAGFLVAEGDAQHLRDLESGSDGLGIRGIGRVAFRRINGGPHALLLISGFTFQLRPGYAASELPAAPERLTIIPLSDSGIRVSTSRPVDPVVLVDYGYSLVAAGVVADSGITFDWSTIGAAR